MSLSGAGTEHRAQTMLYALLMGERYVTRVEEGLLFYLGGGGGGGGDNGANGAPVTCSPGEVWRVRTGWNEVRGLIMARNEVVSWNARRELGGRGKATGRGGGDDRAEDVKRKGVEMCVEDDIEEPFLPPTVDDRRICGRCYVVDTCMLYRKVSKAIFIRTSRMPLTECLTGDRERHRHNLAHLRHLCTKDGAPHTRACRVLQKVGEDDQYGGGGCGAVETRDVDNGESGEGGKGKVCWRVGSGGGGQQRRCGE